MSEKLYTQAEYQSFIDSVNCRHDKIVEQLKKDFAAELKTEVEKTDKESYNRGYGEGKDRGYEDAETSETDAYDRGYDEGSQECLSHIDLTDDHISLDITYDICRDVALRLYATTDDLTRIELLRQYYNLLKDRGVFKYMPPEKILSF